MPRIATLNAVLLATFAVTACATRAPVQTKEKPAAPAEPARVAVEQSTNETSKTSVVPAPPVAAAPAPAADATEADYAPTVPEPSTAEQFALLRVEAGALVTRVNGDPRLACTHPDCSIPLPPGTHRFTVGYKEAVRQTGTGVTFASMRSREIELTLEPGHHYSVSTSGKSTPAWRIAVHDQTADRVVYSDRAPRPD